MTALRILLSIMLLGIAAYTTVTVLNHGLNFFPAFFSDIAAIGWPGQFNVDFSSFLLLAATWIAWRHHFSMTGMVLALISPFGGMIFFSSYLLVILSKERPDAAQLLLGQQRAAELRSR